MITVPPAHPIAETLSQYYYYCYILQNHLYTLDNTIIQALPHKIDKRMIKSKFL